MQNLRSYFQETYQISTTPNFE